MQQEHSTVSVDCTPPTVEDALRVARLGITVIPLKPSTKEPCFKYWKERATTDPDTIMKWWSHYPHANVGHVIPRGRLVLDIDPRSGGLAGWNNLLAQHGDLPATWQVTSGRLDGGFHLYFKVPPDIDLPFCTNISGPGVQVLGLEHLVVLPPSLHPDTGQPYTWDAEHSPFDFCAEAPAPDWLIALTLNTAKRHAKATGRLQRDQPQEIFPVESNKVLEVLTPPLGTLFDGTQPSPSEGPGARLVAMACDPHHLPAMLAACGLPPSLCVGCSTCCPMHADTHPSATLLGPTAERRSYGLYCHASGCQRYYSLTDIFHYKTSGNVLHLHTEIDAKGQVLHHTALRLQWTTRLLEAASVVHLYELGAPTLPSHAPEEARDLWTIFLHVRRMRSATRKASAPLPFSLRFIQDWAGTVYAWTAYRVNAAKRWLIAHGYLELAGKDGLDSFWRVGKPALRRARSDAPILRTEAATVADVAATPLPAPTEHTSACPDAEEPGHSPQTCVICRAQQRLEERRAQEGIWHNPHDPYGWKGSIHE